MERSSRPQKPGGVIIFRPEDFPKGDNGPLEKVYRAYYAQYMNWARGRWSLADDLLADAFNEAVLVFRKKAWEGLLEGYRGKGVNTILFSFAANLVKNCLKKEGKHQSRMVPLSDETGEPEAGESFEPSLKEEEEAASAIDDELNGPLFRSPAVGRMAELKKGMAGLTERCRKILVYRIVHGFSMPEIAEQLDMANADTAKTAKNKCLKRLRTLMARLPKGS